MTHEPRITPSRLDLERMNTEAALARALELLAEREREVARLRAELHAIATDNPNQVQTMTMLRTIARQALAVQAGGE